MDDYFMMGTHIPPFGSWDSGEYLQFTEYFDSAREAELLHYTNYQQHQEDELQGDEDGFGDLYVTGDLYQNDVVTSAVIYVPSNRSKAPKQAKKQSRWDPNELSDWPQRKAASPVKAVKPVDEDLYRISPELLHKNVKKKRGFGFFASCCMVPNCLM